MLIFPGEKDNLVWVGRYGLMGFNFYWYRHESVGITKEEIIKTGVVDGNLLVHKDIIPALVLAQEILMRDAGCGLCIKEGWRPELLYKLIYNKRVERNGQEEADSIFNMEDMFHASGKSVDVVLWDFEKGEEIQMRDYSDGVPAFFYGFYKDMKDERAMEYHKLQTLLRDVMFEVGFDFGTKLEYFHFNFVKQILRNYISFKNPLA